MTITYIGEVVLISGEDVMKVREVIEAEDGSAVVKMDLDADEVSVLIEYALQSLLIKAAKEEIEKNAKTSV